MAKENIPDIVNVPKMPPIKPAKSDIRRWFVAYFWKTNFMSGTRPIESGFDSYITEDKNLNMKSTLGYDKVLDQIREGYKNRNNVITIINFIEME